ncbi:MAG: hypothetical protein R6U96_02835 [Promethearchaeia archaeon]
MKEKIFIHALIISDEQGRFLVDLIRNKNLDTAQLSGFISALKMFGEETLGDIEAISIDGLDIDMLVVSKYDLVFISIMDTYCAQITDFRKGCEKALDTFYKKYKDKLFNWDGDLRQFREFKDILKDQVKKYLEKMREYERQMIQVVQKDKNNEDLKRSKRRFSKKRGE